MTTLAPSALGTPARKAPPAAVSPKLRPLIEYLDGLSGRADLGALSALLERLAITRADIEGFCVFGSRGYKRNTISASPWYELLGICWRSGQCSTIHDHAGSSCAFKVVEGQGTEVRFELSPSGLICPVVATKMDPGYICAAEDADIHQVANMQAAGVRGVGGDLVTLHMYSPPIKRMTTYCYGETRPMISGGWIDGDGV